MDLNALVRLCKTRRLHSALVFAYARGLRDYVAPLEILLSKEMLTEKTRHTARDFVCCTFRGMLWPHEQVQDENEERIWLSRGQVDVANWIVRGGKMSCLLSDGQDVHCVLRAVKILLFEQNEHVVFEENDKTSPFLIRRKGEQESDETRGRIDPKRAPSKQRILDTTIATCRELIRTIESHEHAWTREYYTFLMELAAATQRLRVETSDLRDATLKLASRAEEEDVFIRVVRGVVCVTDERERKNPNKLQHRYKNDTMI